MRRFQSLHVLSVAADGVSKTLVNIGEKYDGGTMAGLDNLTPGADKYRGRAREAGSVD